jgi:hypothetical protein
MELVKTHQQCDFVKTSSDAMVVVVVIIIIIISRKYRLQRY